MVFSSDQACETPTNFWKTLCHTVHYPSKEKIILLVPLATLYTALECYNPFPYSEMNIE